MSEQEQAMQAVAIAVSNASGVPIGKILGNRRHGKIVTARHVAKYIMRKQLKFTYDQIGEYFGRDHSTVIHAVQKVSWLIQNHDQEYADLVRMTMHRLTI